MAVAGRSYDLDWLLELLVSRLQQLLILDFSYSIEVECLIEVAAR